MALISMQAHDRLEEKHIADDELCVLFLNSNTAKAFEKDVPKEGLVISDMLDDGEVIIVPINDYINWLYGEGVHCEKEN